MKAEFFEKRATKEVLPPGTKCDFCIRDAIGRLSIMRSNMDRDARIVFLCETCLDFVAHAFREKFTEISLGKFD